eukprot:scpid101720/ scgid35686/ 
MGHMAVVTSCSDGMSALLLERTLAIKTYIVECNSSAAQWCWLQLSGVVCTNYTRNQRVRHGSCCVAGTDRQTLGCAAATLVHAASLPVCIRLGTTVYTECTTTVLG